MTSAEFGNHHPGSPFGPGFVRFDEPFQVVPTTIEEDPVGGEPEMPINLIEFEVQVIENVLKFLLHRKENYLNSHSVPAELELNIELTINRIAYLNKQAV